MYHISNLGSFAGPVRPYADKAGYVPQADDGPWDLDYDHGMERGHDDETGELTEYGEWWEFDRWPEIRDAAVKATAEALSDHGEWQQTQTL